MIVNEVVDLTKRLKQKCLIEGGLLKGI